MQNRCILLQRIQEKRVCRVKQAGGNNPESQAGSADALDESNYDIDGGTPEQLAQRHDEFESLKASIMDQGEGNARLVEAIVGFKHLQAQQVRTIR